MICDPNSGSLNFLMLSLLCLLCISLVVIPAEFLELLLPPLNEL